MQIKKYNIKKIASVFKKIPRAIAEHFFNAIFVLLLVVLLLGGLIFYKYDFLYQKKSFDVSTDVLKFNEDIYQRILIVWFEKEKRFNESDNKIYLDPFKLFTEELTK